MVEGLKERFASIRREYGLNVKEFAASLDMEPTTLSSIETGKREPSKEVLLNLAVKYAVSLNWIFTGVGEKRLSKSILEQKHPLIADFETLIKENIAGIETRLSAIEERLIATPEPVADYPTETEDKASYTQDPEPEYGQIPYRDDVAAGLPIDPSDDASMVVDVPLRHIKTKPEDYYALRVRGNSMMDALIPDGSMVLIQKSDVPHDGKIQAVLVDGRGTLKRMREGEDHSWTLCYEDGTGRTIPLGEENLVRGDFVAVLPPYTKPKMRGE